MNAYKWAVAFAVLGGLPAIAAGTVEQHLIGESPPPAAADKRINVPSHVIYAGQIISIDDLQEVNWRRLPAAASRFALEKSDLLGRVAMRSLITGYPVPRDAVRKVHVVIQGQATIMLMQLEGLRISGYGIPLQSGGIGETIDIRNQQTGLVTRGKILSGQTVDVSGAP